jgi:hypothetical protein
MCSAVSFGAEAVGENGVLDKIFSVASAAWTLVLMAAVALFKAWPAIMGRFNERRRDNATEKAEDWHRLRAEIDRKDARIANLEKVLSDTDDENSELRKVNINLLARAVTAESALQGIGHARQEAAAIVAAERLTEKKPEGNGK